MKTVFVALHEATAPTGGESIKLIGVYSTMSAAMHAVELLRTQPGFAETPDGFAVDEYVVDRTVWADGFVWST